ncbi:MAG: triphosphoribosyl-dephospho-CoA synthase [Planctomycetaceae bacterium]|nr:triphosphoribosyl-dephospho-CoA synthase [Planctomycetaceae bacterium]
MTLWQVQLAKWIRLACTAEVLAPKPGNVSPQRSFENTFVHDFLASAEAIAPELAAAEYRSVGRSVLSAVRATWAAVGQNTNLGIVLLIAPLAAVPPHCSLAEGVVDVLDRLTCEDSQLVYEAIRLANPSGLGTMTQQDVRQIPDLPLRECMRLAADRDQIAAQYAEGYPLVLTQGIEWLRDLASSIKDQSLQVVGLAIRLLAEVPDSLIIRKCGPTIASTVQQLARDTIAAEWPHTENSLHKLQELEMFLSADGNQRNPGTTADLVAAILFAAQREGWWTAQEDYWEQLQGASVSREETA